MALSDRDLQVLQDYEAELLTAARHERWVFPVRRRAAAGLVAASTGVALGLVVLFLGLRLASTVGTCVGVGGAVLLIVTACLGMRDLLSGPRHRTGGPDLRPPR